jgi:hypothetical protein
MKIKNKEIDLIEWHKSGNKTKIDYQDELNELWHDPKYKNNRFKHTTYKFLYYDPK